MKQVLQFGGVPLAVGGDVSFRTLHLSPQAMGILGVDLDDVHADEGKVRERDDPEIDIICVANNILRDQTDVMKQ
jgi:hypothetical protein